MLDAGDWNSLGTQLLTVLWVMELGKQSKRVSKKYMVAEKRKGFVLRRGYVFKFSLFQKANKC